MAFPFARSDFPPGFRFGVATAAYQVEGTAFGDCGPSHWDSFAAAPGNVLDGSSGARACEHYTRYGEDMDLAAGAGFDSWRFSANWARVMPGGRRASAAGLDFYDRLTDAMLARGLAPHLTLYHWDMPAALADLGGWRNPDVVHWFSDYAEALLGRIGDRMHSVATINEPWCVAWLSHFLGLHAPGLRDIRAAARAMHHVLLAHAAAMEAMRARGQRNLGIVLNFEPGDPASDSPQDRAAAARHNAIYNRWFIEALMHGRYPEEALAGLGAHLPAGWEAQMPRIAQPIDWLGVNYYTRMRARALPEAPWPAYAAAPPEGETTDMGWEVYPQGLSRVLRWLAREHTGDLPLFVTENGMAGDEAAQVAGAIPNPLPDPQRCAYFASHLAEVRAALADGVPVRGYFAWSLLDNFEWAFGYTKRFGLVHVDYATQARTPKTSLHDFAQMLGGRGIL